MPCVYILYSDKSGKYYTGSSREDDALKRLHSHNSGKVRSTKSGKPWKIIHNEVILNYSEARRREIFLKSGVGRNWIKEKFGSLKTKE